jgi:hypothetical protein
MVYFLPVYFLLKTGNLHGRDVSKSVKVVEAGVVGSARFSINGCVRPSLSFY